MWPKGTEDFSAIIAKKIKSAATKKKREKSISVQENGANQCREQSYLNGHSERRKKDVR